MTAFIWTMVVMNGLGAVVIAARIGKVDKPLTPAVAAGAIAIRLALVTWAVAVLP